MKKVLIYFAIIILAIFGTFYIYQKIQKKPQQIPITENRPNIILILGDDIGYSDIGPFGSEIKTPNLDRLADEGIRFSNFYNMSKCEPSRSSLFTGLYEGGKNSVNFAQILKNQGYYVIHSGKEHWMKWAPEHVFAKNIFDQSLTFKAMSEFFEPPSADFVNPFYLNGKHVSAQEIYHENEPFFKTDVLTDNALKWMDEVAYMSAHRFARKDILTISAGPIKFKKAIPYKSFIVIEGKVANAGRVKLTISVKVYIEDKVSSIRVEAISGDFVFVAVDENLKPVRLM